MEKLKLDKNNLRKFAITMGVAFFFIGLLILLKGKHSPGPVFIISAIFFILALRTSFLLKPLYIVWMKLAFILNWLNTRIILFFLFYLIFTPIGLMIRLLGIDLLDRRIEKNKDSYWKEKENKELNPSEYERQF